MSEVAKKKKKKPEAPFGKPKKNSAGADTFLLDLTEVSESSFRIEAGKYQMRLLDIEKKMSSNDKPMLVWSFKLIGGKYANREFKMWTVISKDAGWKIVETLKAFGIDAAGKKLEIDKKQLVGLEVYGHVVDGKFNDEPTSNLKKVTPLVIEDEDNDYDDEDEDDEEDSDEDSDDDSDEDDSETDDEESEDDESDDSETSEEDEEDSDEDEDAEDETALAAAPPEPVKVKKKKKSQ